MIPNSLQDALGQEAGGVFYLYGEEEHLKGEAAVALVEAHLDPATRDFNFDPLRGSEVTLEALASTLGTPPMMAEWRVVLLRETEALASSPRARAALLEVVENPPPGLALILLCTPPERTKARFYDDLKAKARSVQFRRISPNDLPDWIVTWTLDRLDREVEIEAARAIAGAVGSDLAMVVREVEKLATLAEAGEPIGLEHVRAAGTSIPQQDRWEWFDLVGEARFEEALRGLKVLLEHGESGVGLTVGLATHLLRLGLAVDGGQNALSAALSDKQGWLARRYLGQAKRWSAHEVEAALEGLLRVDQLLKSSSFSDQHLLESWMLERMTREAAA